MSIKRVCFSPGVDHEIVDVCAECFYIFHVFENEVNFTQIEGITRRNLGSYLDQGKLHSKRVKITKLHSERVHNVTLEPSEDHKATLGTSVLLGSAHC